MLLSMRGSFAAGSSLIRDITAGEELSARSQLSQSTSVDASVADGYGAPEFYSN